MTDAPTGSNPLFFLDLNDTLVTPVNPNDRVRDQQFIGLHDAGEEHFAATALRRLCRKFGRGHQHNVSNHPHLLVHEGTPGEAD